MNLRFRLLLAVASVLVAIGIVAACTNQGEGEVCNFANGDDDCQTDNGLACYLANTLGNNNVTSDRCCPTNRALATHPACIVPVSVTGSGDATAPANTGPDVNDAQVATDSGAATDAADQ